MFSGVLTSEYMPVVVVMDPVMDPRRWLFGEMCKFSISLLLLRFVSVGFEVVAVVVFGVLLVGLVLVLVLVLVVMELVFVLLPVALLLLLWVV